MRDYDHYVVWVGGLELDNYMTKDQAERAAESWKDEGYDQVRIEKVYYDEGSWTV